MAKLPAAALPADVLEKWVPAGLLGLIVVGLFGIPLSICATASTSSPPPWWTGPVPGAALVLLLTGLGDQPRHPGPGARQMLGGRGLAAYLAGIFGTASAGGLLVDGWYRGRDGVLRGLELAEHSHQALGMGRGRPVARPVCGYSWASRAGSLEKRRARGLDRIGPGVQNAPLLGPQRRPGPSKTSQGESVMSRVCSITGRGTQSGGLTVRRGLPKKSGGIGLNITGRSKRKFKVNVQPKRVWVPELGEFVRVRLSTKAQGHGPQGRLQGAARRGPAQRRPHPRRQARGLIRAASRTHGHRPRSVETPRIPPVWPQTVFPFRGDYSQAGPRGSRH
ncbi:MAG: 50S ribosomal protein L28 [Planctomycetota bacterium]